MDRAATLTRVAGTAWQGSAFDLRPTHWDGGVLAPSGRCDWGRAHVPLYPGRLERGLTV